MRNDRTEMKGRERGEEVLEWKRSSPSLCTSKARHRLTISNKLQHRTHWLRKGGSRKGEEEGQLMCQPLQLSKRKEVHPRRP